MKEEKKKGIGSRSGQVAVIVILITAIVLVFYAVTLNLGRLSQVKTVTTVASNQATSLMASQMASYSQSLFKQTLGGVKKKCRSNGILQALISLIVVVAIIVATGGLGAGASSLVNFLSALSLGLSSLAVVLQMTVIQPGLTSLWNKATIEVLSTTNSFLEQGIRAGLQASVQDQKQIIDDIDLDQDRLCATCVPSSQNDVVSRFGIYYSKRLAKVQKLANQAVDDFIEALDNLVNGYNPDRKLMEECLANCSASGNLLSCQNMPTVNSVGEPYVWTSPPSTFLETPDCDLGSNIPNEPWKTEIENNLGLTVPEWALYDPVRDALNCQYNPATNPNVPSECNPC